MTTTLDWNPEDSSSIYSHTHKDKNTKTISIWEHALVKQRVTKLGWDYSDEDTNILAKVIENLSHTSCETFMN